MPTCRLSSTLLLGPRSLNVCSTKTQNVTSNGRKKRLFTLKAKTHKRYRVKPLIRHRTHEDIQAAEDRERPREAQAAP